MSSENETESGNKGQHEKDGGGERDAHMPIESSQDHDHRPCVGTKYASPTTTAKARLRASLSLAFGGGRRSGGSGGPAKTLFGSATGLGVGGTAETEAADFEVLAAGYGLGTSSSSSPSPARKSGCRPPVVLFANQEEGVDADAEEDEEDGNGMDGDHHEVRRGYEDFMHDIEDIKHLHHHVDRDEEDAVDEHVGEEAAALADPFPPSAGGDVLAAAAVQGIAGAGSSGAYLDPIPEGGETTSPEPSSPGGGLVLERSCEDEDLLGQETKVVNDNADPNKNPNTVSDSDTVDGSININVGDVKRTKNEDGVAEVDAVVVAVPPQQVAPKVEDEPPALAREHSNPDVNIENADETSSSGNSPSSPSVSSVVNPPLPPGAEDADGAEIEIELAAAAAAATSTTAEQRQGLGYEHEINPEIIIPEVKTEEKPEPAPESPNDSVVLNSHSAKQVPELQQAEERKVAELETRKVVKRVSGTRVRISGQGGSGEMPVDSETRREPKQVIVRDHRMRISPKQVFRAGGHAVTGAGKIGGLVSEANPRRILKTPTTPAGTAATQDNKLQAQRRQVEGDEEQGVAEVVIGTARARAVKIEEDSSPATSAPSRISRNTSSGPSVIVRSSLALKAKAKKGWSELAAASHFSNLVGKVKRGRPTAAAEDDEDEQEDVDVSSSSRSSSSPKPKGKAVAMTIASMLQWQSRIQAEQEGGEAEDESATAAEEPVEVDPIPIQRAADSKRESQEYFDFSRREPEIEYRVKRVSASPKIRASRRTSLGSASASAVLLPPTTTPPPPQEDRGVVSVPLASSDSETENKPAAALGAASATTAYSADRAKGSGFSLEEGFAGSFMEDEEDEVDEASIEQEGPAPGALEADAGEGPLQPGAGILRPNPKNLGMVPRRTSDNPDVASRRASQLEETLRVQKEKKRKEQEAAKQQQQEMEKKLTDLQQQVARISQINSSILDQQAKAQQENESLQATLDEKQVHIESLTATIEEKSVLIARKDLEAFSAGAGSTTREMWKEKQMKKAAEFLVTQPVAPAGGGSKTKAAAGELTWKGVGALVEEDFHDPMLQYSAYHDNFHAHDLHGEEHFDDPSLSRPPLFHSLEVLGSAAGAASTTSTVVDKIMDRHGGTEYMQQQISTHASGLSTNGMEAQNPPVEVDDGEQEREVVVDDGTLVEFTPLVQGELQVEVKREKLFRLRKEAATFFNDTENATPRTAVERVEHDLRTSQAILLELLNDELKEHHGQQNGPLSPEGVRLRAEASYALEKAKLENYLDSLKSKPLASGAARSGDAAGAGATYQNRDKLFESEIDRKMGSLYSALREIDTATMVPEDKGQDVDDEAPTSFLASMFGSGKKSAAKTGNKKSSFGSKNFASSATKILDADDGDDEPPAATRPSLQTRPTILDAFFGTGEYAPAAAMNTTLQAQLQLAENTVAGEKLYGEPKSSSSSDSERTQLEPPQNDLDLHAQPVNREEHQGAAAAAARGESFALSNANSSLDFTFPMEGPGVVRRSGGSSSSSSSSASSGQHRDTLNYRLPKSAVADVERDAAVDLKTLRTQEAGEEAYRDRDPYAPYLNKRGAGVPCPPGVHVPAPRLAPQLSAAAGGSGSNRASASAAAVPLQHRSRQGCGLMRGDWDHNTTLSTDFAPRISSPPPRRKPPPVETLSGTAPVGNESPVIVMAMPLLPRGGPEDRRIAHGASGPTSPIRTRPNPKIIGTRTSLISSPLAIRKPGALPVSVPELQNNRTRRPPEQALPSRSRSPPVLLPVSRDRKDRDETSAVKTMKTDSGLMGDKRKASYYAGMTPPGLLVTRGMCFDGTPIPALGSSPFALGGDEQYC